MADLERMTTAERQRDFVLAFAEKAARLQDLESRLPAMLRGARAQAADYRKQAHPSEGGALYYDGKASAFEFLMEFLGITVPCQGGCDWTLTEDFASDKEVCRRCGRQKSDGAA